MGRDHHRSRNTRQGLVLIVVLVGVLLIAALAGTMRATASATVAVLARFHEGHRLALAEDSVMALVRADMASATSGNPQGTAPDPYVIDRDGWQWQVQITDVEGLIDLYTAPPPVIGLLPDVDHSALLAARTRLLAELGFGTQLLTKDQTMAALGLDPAARDRLAPLVTQRARTGEINPDLAPPELAAEARLIAEIDIAGGDLAEITVRRLP